MSEKITLIHTYLDKEASERIRTNVWKSKLTEFELWTSARAAMVKEWSRYVADNADSLVAVSLTSGSASVEYADGCKEIWTLVEY